MEYQFVVSGERVRLDVLVNVDSSVVGLEVDSCKIISMAYDEYLSIVKGIMGIGELKHFERTVRKYHAIQDDRLIVLETVEKKDVSNLALPELYFDWMKFYKSADIFSCYKVSYKYESGKIKFGGLGEVLLREHGIIIPTKRYSMKPEEKVDFKYWVDTHQKICTSKVNDKFGKMKRLYLESYLLDDSDLSFVMLNIVLEMFAGASTEVSFRISRNVSFFLSTNLEEMKINYSKIRKLYGIRSKYVHEGKTVSWDDLFELREMVRSILVLMYEKSMHLPEYDFKEYLKELGMYGYVE